MSGALNCARPRTLLLCAATQWEARPIVRKFGLQQRDRGIYEGMISGHSVTLLKTGMGPKKSEQALRQVKDPSRFSYVLSTGFAGALQAGMNCGDIVADLKECDIEVLNAARGAAEAAPRKTSIHFGKIAHSDTVLATPESKNALGSALRAGAVDMETAEIRRWAAERGLRALAVRVVLDRVDQSLPGDLPANENFSSLFLYALKNFKQLPLLLSLGIRQRRSMSKLTLFLENFIASLPLA